MSADEPLHAWYEALIVVRRRFIEVIASSLPPERQAEAFISAAYATSDSTRTLLLACSGPIRRFVSEELGGRPLGPEAQNFAAELRKPLSNAPTADIEHLLRPHVERLLVSGVAVGAIMTGSLSETDPAYALIEDLLLLCGEPFATATYYAWLAASADITRILIQGGANGMGALKRLGTAEVAAFVVAARSLGQLDKRKYQKTLRAFATTYLMLGYALYLMHTRDYNATLADRFMEFMAQAMVESIAAELPEPRG